MSDSAKGPSAGYIFQFEIALLELSQLSKDEFISIEKVDDVAKEDANGTYICTIQAKNSIASSGKTFGSTSEDLWKTINIWITKLNDGILTSKVSFVAISNKTIPNNSIVRKFKKVSFDQVYKEIEELKKQQEVKLNEKISKGERGLSIIKTIKRLEITLANKKQLKIIVENFELKNVDDVKAEFLNKINFSTIDNKDTKDNIYHTFLGWITDNSKEKWKDKKEAKFSKKDFETKFRLIIGNPQLLDAIFRTKKNIESASIIDSKNIDRKQIYIRQLEEIEREFNEDIIKEAIMDFILCDIEITHLITNPDGNSLTKNDFEEFEKKCEDHWNRIKRKHIKNKISSYNDEELNIIACNIYDEIMSDLKLDFQDYFGFNDSNKYLQNGTFLKLSDRPKIGWHPEWEKKYK